MNKIDFVGIIEVRNANPNGDPLDGNRPRQNYEGYGEISDVCLKRKIRNRLQDMGEAIFVQSADRAEDGYKSLKDRADGCPELKAAFKAKDKDEALIAAIATEKWLDVRAFGQLFAFKADSVSKGIRGPVSLHPAFSVDPITSTSTQITKSVNSETKDKRGADTMGMKHRVDYGLYIFKGSINAELAQKTGFSEADAEKIKEALRTLFVNDASSARPEGSMELKTLYWWRHNCPVGQYSAAEVHRSLRAAKREGVDSPRSFEDYEITLQELPGLTPEILRGL